MEGEWLIAFRRLGLARLPGWAWRRRGAVLASSSTWAWPMNPHLFALASGVLTHNSKPNGLPESVTDRVRRSHEQWFHFTKEPRYFAAVDEVREPQVDPERGRSGLGSCPAPCGPSPPNRQVPTGSASTTSPPTQLAAPPHHPRMVAVGDLRRVRGWDGGRSWRGEVGGRIRTEADTPAVAWVCRPPGTWRSAR